MDGATPVRLGDGRALALSPDGRWALALLEHRQELVALPTRAGEARPLPTPGFVHQGFAAWGRDDRIVFAGSESTGGTRCYLAAFGEDSPRAVTPEGTGLMLSDSPLSPDDRFLATSDPERRLTLYPLKGDNARHVEAALPGDRVVAWSSRSDVVWVRQPAELPTTIFRIELEHGVREPWKELRPADSAGVAAIDIVRLSRDARSYAYSYIRTLSDLYLVEGLTGS